MYRWVRYNYKEDKNKKGKEDENKENSTNRYYEAVMCIFCSNNTYCDRL